MRKLTLEIPDELIDLIGGNETQAGRLMTEATAAELVRRRVISSGKACELLELSPWDLPDVLRSHEVSAIDFKNDDLEPFTR